MLATLAATFTFSTQHPMKALFDYVEKAFDSAVEEEEEEEEEEEGSSGVGGSGGGQMDKGIRAKIRAEVAKESTRNEKITKKSLKTKFSAYVYAPRLICVRIAMIWAALPS
ncbi:hypothetical protein PIB30_067307 [Stylosanthes scabra]|uniref:Uncharacterized protein n=1 Tax=Stylosanthes scabra TaxID=79078 RepID=A0ABU6XMM0_9FABA|nr:hypothetical protein [Stylosanthes scabra]